MSKKKTAEKVIFEAYPMSSMEFLYDFLEPEEFLEMKEFWKSQDLSSNALLYPEKVEIWLLTKDWRRQ